MCANGVEVSLFANSETVDRAFADSIHTTNEPDNRKVVIGDAEWVALEISFHGDHAWDKSGERVKDLSSPLAQAGISILFLSTYNSDYILVQYEELADVTNILEGSGFSFTSEEGDEEPLSSSTGNFTSSSSVGRARAASNGSESRMGGSLVFSESSSAGGSRSPVSLRGLSRSGSGSKSLATGFRPSPSTPIIPSSTESSPINPSTNLPPDLDSTASTNSSALSSRRPSLKLGRKDDTSPDDTLSILPDELVVVGLSSTATHEAIWRTKIVSALFYPERVLDKPKTSTNSSSSHSRRSSQARLSPSTLLSSLSLSQHDSAASASSSSQQLDSRARSSSTSSSSSSSSSSNSSSSSSSPSHNQLPTLNRSTSLSTSNSLAPIPFIALTQTQEGTSFTCDIRLLRALFSEAEELEMVYAVGNGGIKGIWAGEDDVTEGCEGVEELSSKKLKKRVSSRGRKSGRNDGQESGRERRKYNGEDISGDSELDEELEREDMERERRERRQRRELSDAAADGGRTLLKCLQLDLVSFGLGKQLLPSFDAIM